jgi:hypothetical protein
MASASFAVSQHPLHGLCVTRRFASFQFGDLSIMASAPFAVLQHPLQGLCVTRRFACFQFGVLASIALDGAIVRVGAQLGSEVVTEVTK